MAAIRKENWTAGEYLEFERANGVRHEFIDGEIRMMTGGSRRHNLITGNINASLVYQLKGRSCESYASDMRVKIAARRYLYPDIVVACDHPEFEDGQFDTLINPTVIIEVLSPSTKDYDRNEKFAMYRALPTLQDYLLIAPYEPRIERYSRSSADGTWQLTEIIGLSASLELTSIGCKLALSDVYDKVTFED